MLRPRLAFPRPALTCLCRRVALARLYAPCLCRGWALAQRLSLPTLGHPERCEGSASPASTPPPARFARNRRLFRFAPFRTSLRPDVQPILPPVMNHQSSIIKSFTIRTSAKPAGNSFRIRTYKTQRLKSFRIRTYEKSGVGVSSFKSKPHLPALRFFFFPARPDFSERPPGARASPLGTATSAPSRGFSAMNPGCALL